MLFKRIATISISAALTSTIIVKTIPVSELFANSENLYAKIKVLTSVLETIQRSYIEKKDSDELVEDAIRGVIKNLDPHTVYLPADDFKSWNQSFEGYTGIGISFEIIDGPISVMSVIDGSPASISDIQPRDKILRIDDEPTVGLTKEEAAKLLNGPIGASIKLLVKSERWREPKNMRLVRERIVLNSVQQTLMIAPGVGYVKLDRFTSNSSRELDTALKKLKRDGMANLILDLRGNSGGYLNAAVEIADKFIPGGNSIVTTRGRLASSFQEFYSTDENTHKLYPLIILIDHGSASASEIVAGAIQDLDRGLIVGKTSFGKGLVQSQYRFHDGSALLITTARYYTPSGRPIQRNFYNKTKDDYYREAYIEGEQNQEIDAKQTYKTRLGRIVYAEHGIKPDIRIETKENVLSPELRALYFSQKRYLYRFVQKLAARLPDWRDKEDHFIREFRISEEMVDEFLSFVGQHDIALVPPVLGSEDNRNDMKFLLKREMAYMLWGSEARFKVNMERDRQLQGALQHLAEANHLLSMSHL